MGSKCGKRATYNFDDQHFPKFCELHKYEGMVDVGLHTRAETTPTVITKSNKGGHTAHEKVGVGKGKGKRVVTGKKGPGRPSGASSIGEFCKDSKPINSYFSQSAKIKSPRKDAKPNPQAQALLELEQRLVSVEGLSRTEARHLAMATMASLEGASTLDHQEAAEGGLGVVEGKTGVEENEGQVQFPVISCTKCGVGVQ